MALDKLVELEGDEAGHQGGGGGNGGDDPTRDTLGGEAVSRGDGVVLSTQIARRCTMNNTVVPYRLNLDQQKRCLEFSDARTATRS